MIGVRFEAMSMPMASSAPEPEPGRLSRRAAASVPPFDPTLSVRAHAVADQATLATFRRLRNVPDDAEWARIRAELDQAAEQFARAGWLDDPRAFHAAPTTLTDPQLRDSRVGPLRVERLKFDSGWTPPAGGVGAPRWLSYEANRVARATVLRHRGGDRPWVICVHGTGMGRDADLRAFHVRELFGRLDCNVVLPILPLHGPRRAEKGSGGDFPSPDALDNVHGLAQAAHDVRCIIDWIRTQSPTAIAIQGVSLGGYVAALVAGLESPLDCVIAIIPATDFPSLFRRHTTPAMVARIDELLEPMRVVHTVVSPLRVEPSTPVERRYIAAGLVDRLIDPVEQVAPMWEHWGRPTIHWYPGGHIGYVVRGDVQRFVVDALTRSGVTRPA